MNDALSDEPSDAVDYSMKQEMAQVRHTSRWQSHSTRVQAASA